MRTFTPLFAAGLAAAIPGRLTARDDTHCMLQIKVAQDNTLNVLARYFDTGPCDIFTSNKDTLKDPNSIGVGQLLNVVAKQKQQDNSCIKGPKPYDPNHQDPHPKVENYNGIDYIDYTVSSGETLTTIANDHNTGSCNIFNLTTTLMPGKYTDPDSIKPGNVLDVPFNTPDAMKDSNSCITIKAQTIEITAHTNDKCEDNPAYSIGKHNGDGTIQP